MLNDARVNNGILVLKTLSKLKKGRPIDLQRFVAVPRFGISGISTGKFGRFWFVLPKGKALFKIFDDNGFVMPRNLALINELLCSRLAKQIDLPCADYELAVHGGHEGLVSYNLLNEDEQMMDCMFFEISRVAQEIDDYISMGVSIDKQNVLENLFKAVIFQLITLQTDSKVDGFVFAKNEKINSIRFAGIVDNEFAFNIQHFSPPLPNEDAFGLFGAKRRVRVEDVIKDFDSCSDFRNLIGQPYISIFKNQSGDFEYSVRLKEICDCAKTYSRAKEILTQVLSSLDVDKAFDDMKKQDKVEVDKNYKTYVKSIVEFGKKQFEKGLSQEQS